MSAPVNSGATLDLTVHIENIVVAATLMEVDAGIDLLPGDSVGQFTASGTTGHTGQSQWGPTGDGKGASDDKFACPRASAFSLAAWTGSAKDDGFQAMASEGVSSPDRTVGAGGLPAGDLRFAMNDHDDAQVKYDNNTGSFVAGVTVRRTVAVHAEGTDAAAAWGAPVLRLGAGDTVSITAQGSIAYWDGGDQRGPDGVDQALTGLLAPGLRAHSLVGRLGSGEPVAVGAILPAHVVSGAGPLQLSLNDQIEKSGAFTNNTGNLKVEVTVHRAPPA